MNNLAEKADLFDYSLMARINFDFSHLSHDDRSKIYDSHVHYLNSKSRELATAKIWSIINSDGPTDLEALNRALKAHPDVAHHSITLASEMEGLYEIL